MSKILKSKRSGGHLRTFFFILSRIDLFRQYRRAAILLCNFSVEDPQEFLTIDRFNFDQAFSNGIELDTMLNQQFLGALIRFIY